MGSAEEFMRGLNGKSNVQLLPGTYLGLNGLQVIVDFGGGQVPADSAMEGLPLAGDSVWIQLIDGRRPTMVGYTVPKPGQGIVSDVVGNLANVTTTVGELIGDAYPAGLLTPADVGDTVKIMWGEGPFIIALMSEAPVIDVPGGGGSGAGVIVERAFWPIDAGSWRAGSGWWQPQVWASDSNKGIWGYSTQIPDTIPAAAIPVSIEIFISPVQISGDPPNFGVHVYGTTGGVEPSFALVTPVPVVAGWNTLPLSFVDALKRGGGYLGVGVEHGGYSKFRSRAEDPDSGLLRIRYR